MVIEYPESFFEIRIQHFDLSAALAVLCSGYEGGTPRTEGLAAHLFNWIPYVGLNQEHQLALNSSNFVDMLSVAANHIYNSKKTESRGEIGELILHLACINYFSTMPVMCKLVLKTSANDTVKGYDGVHVLPKGDDFEIWLGESKFYSGNGISAITDAVTSVRDHLLPDFIKAEKAMIFGHIAQSIPNREEIVKLFKKQTSGDKLLEKAVFPILITYESKTVSSFQALSEKYTSALKEEIANLETHFLKKCAETQFPKIRFQLIFVPLQSKLELVKHFDKKLEAFL